MTTSKTGIDILKDAALNKSTAFTAEERTQLRIEGLLPPAIATQETQMRRVLENIRRQHSDIERYIFLTELQARNERLFYRVVMENIEELMPLIYTPTVGEACLNFGHIFRRPRGLYVCAHHRGSVQAILDNWPEKDVRVIVVTDGQRVLGLGDLGAGGMGISIGKLSLYTACAGIHPHQCLPIMLDVGTNNENLLNDPLYLGTRSKRIEGDAYYEFVDEFMDCCKNAFPQALIQFEDFATPHAYYLLNHYRDDVLCFNDDIQGTAAVVLAGVLTSTRISGIPIKDLRILFLGAGSAATGAANLMVQALVDADTTLEEANKRIWFVDEQGLIVRSRADLQPHHLAYTHDQPRMSFTEAINTFRPNVLIGATGSPGTFTEEVVRLMAALNERPTIFALSNPTSRAECTAQQAYTWSDGRVIFASGSPFAAVEHQGQRFKPAQGNNVYVFPGVGLGAVTAQAKKIPDSMFLAAANALASLVTEEDLAAGSVYPDRDRIRTVSLAVAQAVMECAYRDKLAQAPQPKDYAKALTAALYDPNY